MNKMISRGIDLLTFRRTSSFVVELIVATMPILFALLLQSPPSFLGSVSVTGLAILIPTLAVVYLLVSVWLLLEAGRSTYSTKLHRLHSAIKSSLLFLLLSFALVLAGYIVLVGGSLDPLLQASVVLTGGVIVFLYALLAVGAHASNIINRTERAEKERLVLTFQRAGEAIQASRSVGTNAIKLEECGRTLQQKLSDEPMVNDVFVGNLDEWLTEFGDYHEMGRIKMVGGAGPCDDLEEPWKMLCKDFEYINGELSVMGTQGT